MNLNSLSLALIPTLLSTSSSFTTPHPTTKTFLSTRTLTTTTTTPKPLFGILDEINSDAFNLQSTPSQPTASDLHKNFEIFLAELVFSPNDPRVDIIENADTAFDEQFLTWLSQIKIEKSTDPEEKLALKDLYEMILDTKKKVELSQLAQEREQNERDEEERKRVEKMEKQMEEGKAMSDTDVLRRAAKVDTAAVDKAEEGGTKEKKKSFMESELTPEIRMSYDALLQKLLPPYQTGETPASVVFTNYDKFDAQLVKVLTERVENGDEDSKQLLEALAKEQQKRISAATENLKHVLSMGDPMRMEGAIVKLAREGKIDEPFLLLLEANVNQAEAAGATGPAQLMKRLKGRAMDEKDKQMEQKPVRLLRKLLRAEDAQEREQLLEDAFTPKDVFIVPGTAENAQKAMEGETPEEQKPMPEVPPPDFINACKAVLLNFGNLDDGKGDMTSRIKQIASEAEVVATRIYGKGMTPKEQQDRMWKEETTSIFDLERMEMEAEQMGTRAPWARENDDDEILPGFDKDGRMKVGGS